MAEAVEEVVVRQFPTACGEGGPGARVGGGQGTPYAGSSRAASTDGSSGVRCQ
ncbi:hypothetical protein ABTZ93_16315 [Streptomyces sp. NPDC097941]|uniref:hypothetical protein n=1 Tax=Streptomyces sp. NPDC097941 TaxID=3155685 RepID=UPI00331C38BE